jgi:hypothetical protein
MSETSQLLAPQLLDVQQQLGLLQLVQQLLKHTSTLPRGVPSPTWKSVIASANQFVFDLPWEVRLLMTRQFLSDLPWHLVWEDIASSPKGHSQVILAVSSSEVAVVESLLNLALDDSYSTTIKLSEDTSLKVQVNTGLDEWTQPPVGAVNLLGERIKDRFTGCLVTFRLESYPAAPVSVDLASEVGGVDASLLAQAEEELDFANF